MTGASPIAAIVLAAGRGRRMGEAGKMTALLAGRPLVRYPVEAALSTPVTPVIVVTGHQEAAVKAALAGLPLTVIDNPRHDEGLASSLRVGLRAVPAEAAGVVILLGDMPRVRPVHIQGLLAAFDPVRGRTICVARHGGRLGHPVLWGRRWFGDLAALRGDVGGRVLLARHRQWVTAVEMADEGVLIDVDDRPTLIALNRVGRPPIA